MRLFTATLLLLVLAGCRRDVAPDAALDSLAHEHTGDSTNATGIVQPPRVPVVSRAVSYGAHTGWLALPEDSTARVLPGLIVVHEWWGLNDNIRRMAERLAGEGYRVLAVDLYNNRVATTPDSAMAFMQAATASPQNVAFNVRGAFNTLAQMGAPKVGILGWCFGGGVAAKMAVAMPLQLDAAVIYYGDPGGITAAQLRPLGMPVRGFFGGKDTSIPVDSVRAFETRLKAAGKDATITVYPEAGHAFANPTGQNYEAGPAEDAWMQTVTFLARTLNQP